MGFIHRQGWNVPPKTILKITFVRMATPGFASRYNAMCSRFKACGWDQIETDIITVKDRTALLHQAFASLRETEIVMFDPTSIDL